MKTLQTSMIVNELQSTFGYSRADAWELAKHYKRAVAVAYMGGWKEDAIAGMICEMERGELEFTGESFRRPAKPEKLYVF